MAKIKNFQELASSPLRKFALEIIESGLQAIDTKNAVRHNVRLDNNFLFIKNKRYSLEKINKIYVIGVGKCSLEAAAVLEEVLGKKISGGIVLDVYKGELRRISSYKGDHPLPSEKNIEITAEIISLLKSVKKEDLVIFIVSGGGSILLCQPQGHTCVEESKIVSSLLKSGMDITKINTVRKHLSLARGGFLAKYAHPAKVISLIFSDVPGHPMEFVASGPTVMDSTTVDDAKKIIKKYDILKRSGLKEIDLIETPKDKKIFKNVDNFIIVSNKVALDAMVVRARELGFIGQIKSINFSGEARKVGEQITDNLDKDSSKIALFYGGESLVAVKGKGSGGRNQELALSALRFIKEGQLILSINSDGRDNSEVAGAICDIITKEKAKNYNLDIEGYLKNNDSHTFFAKTGDYLFTGDTGSNIADLIVAIKE